MGCPDDGCVIPAKEPRNEGRVNRTEVDRRDQVPFPVEARQRWLVTEEAPVDRVANHHGYAGRTVIGSVRSVFFHTTAEFGIHKHRGFGARFRGHRGEEGFDALIKFSQKFSMPAVRIASAISNGLLFMRIEASRHRTHRSNAHIGIHQSGCDDHLTNEAR